MEEIILTPIVEGDSNPNKITPIVSGETYRGMQIVLSVFERDGIVLEPSEPIDLTGAAITATFSYNSPQGAKKIFTDSDITIVDAVNGKFSLLTDTLIDWKAGSYYLYVKVEFPDETVKLFYIGNLIVLALPEKYDECCDYKIIYCECPYAVIPCNKFIVRKNYKNQNISFYICVREGNWGDQSVLDLTNYDVTFQLFDTQDSLYLSKPAEWSSVTKKCKVDFDEWDLKDAGYYYCILDIQHKTEDLGWQVPDKHKRIDLEIK